MRLWKHRFGILALAAVAGLLLLLLHAGNAVPTGSDDLGSARAAQLAGRPVTGFHPLIGQWVPPTGEAEAALFALQAAIGGICIGLALWYWRGLKGEEREEGKG